MTVKGSGLNDVNAFSLALPYSDLQLQYISTEAMGAKNLRNFTRDRLHTNGQKGLYVTFVGVGEAEPLSADQTLCTIRFKAKTAGAVKMEARDIILVDKQLYSVTN